MLPMTRDRMADVLEHYCGAWSTSAADALIAEGFGDVGARTIAVSPMEQTTHASLLADLSRIIGERDAALRQVAAVEALAELGERDGRGNSLDLSRAIRVAIERAGQETP